LATPNLARGQTIEELNILAVKETEIGNNLRAMDFIGKALALDSINTTALWIRAVNENALDSFTDAIHDIGNSSQTDPT